MTNYFLVFLPLFLFTSCFDSVKGQISTQGSVAQTTPFSTTVETVGSQQPMNGTAVNNTQPAMTGTAVSNTQPAMTGTEQTTFRSEVTMTTEVAPTMTSSLPEIPEAANVALIVGVTVGAVVLVAILVAYFCWRRRTKFHGCRRFHDEDGSSYSFANDESHKEADSMAMGEREGGYIRGNDGVYRHVASDVPYEIGSHDSREINGTGVWSASHSHNGATKKWTT